VLLLVPAHRRCAAVPVAPREHPLRPRRDRQLLPVTSCDQAARKGGRHWSVLGQVEAQLAAPPSSVAGLPESAVLPLCVVLYGRKRVKTTCCKSTFRVFHMFQRYVASVVYRCFRSRSRCWICCNGYTHMFQVYVLNVSSYPEICCKCFTWMLQKYIWMLYIHAYCKHMFQVFLDVSYVCLQVLYLNFAYVCMVFKCF
jgi:hypothetical protein